MLLNIVHAEVSLLNTYTVYDIFNSLSSICHIRLHVFAALHFTQLFPFMYSMRASLHFAVVVCSVWDEMWVALKN